MKKTFFLIVGAATKVGLFDAIKNGSHTVQELSEKLNTDYRALWTVTEALAALGYVIYLFPGAPGHMNNTRNGWKMPVS